MELLFWICLTIAWVLLMTWQDIKQCYFSGTYNRPDYEEFKAEYSAMRDFERVVFSHVRRITETPKMHCPEPLDIYHWSNQGAGCRYRKDGTRIDMLAEHNRILKYFKSYRHAMKDTGEDIVKPLDELVAFFTDTAKHYELTGELLNPSEAHMSGTMSCFK